MSDDTDLQELLADLKRLAELEERLKVLKESQGAEQDS